MSNEQNYVEAKQEFERFWLQKVMDDCKYNQVKAASKMKLSRGTLRAKLRAHFGTKYFRDTE